MKKYDKNPKFLIRPYFVSDGVIYSWAAYLKPNLKNPVVTDIAPDGRNGGWAWNCWNGYEGKTPEEVAYKVWSSTNAEHVGHESAEQAKQRLVESEQTIVTKPKTSKLPGFVYLIRATGTSLYKIGRSNSPVFRLRSLETHSPHKLVLLHEIKSADSVQGERLLHQRFVDHRVHGEWFELPQDAVDYICSLEVL